MFNVHSFELINDYVDCLRELKSGQSFSLTVD